MRLGRRWLAGKKLWDDGLVRGLTVGSFDFDMERGASAEVSGRRVSWGRRHVLTERARLARVATTAATKADTASTTEDTAAGPSSRRRRSRASLDSRITDVTRSRTPVGRHDGAAETTAHAGAGSKAGETSTAGAEVHRAVVNGKRALLVEGLLLPPGWVSVEETQLLLGLSVVRHLVLVFAPLLGERTSAVVDPLVTVDLLSAGAAGAGAATVVLDGAGRGGAVETARGKNERAAAARTGRGVDDGINSRLSYVVMICQPSERLRRFKLSASWV